MKTLKPPKILSSERNRPYVYVISSMSFSGVVKYGVVNC